jgi:hypothetical protein
MSLCAAFEKISKNIDFLGHFMAKTNGKYPKYQKSLNFYSILRRKQPVGATPEIDHFKKIKFKK